MQHFHKFITLRLCAAQTCFGRFHAHHQELKLLKQPLVLLLGRGGSSVVGRGPADHDQQRRYHHAPTVKPEAA